MKRQTLLSLTICFVFALGGEPLSFREDASRELDFKLSDTNWGVRSLSVGKWNLGFWSGGWWHSVQAQAEGQIVANGDFIWGSVYAGTRQYPYSWMSFYSSSVEVDRNVSNPNDGVTWQKFDVSVSSGFVASSFLSVVEVSNGSDVSGTEFKFNTLLWTYNSDESTSLTNESAGIYAFVFDGTRVLPPSNTKIQLQYIVTKEAGELDYLSGIYIIPRSVESIVKIDGWKYSSPENRLKLKTAIASAEGTWTADGQRSGGSGDDKVFFHFASDASVNGKMSPVQFGAKVKADASQTFGNADLVFQLNSRYGAKAYCEIVEVIFPAGATSIVYDPAMGSGDSPFDPTSSNPPDNVGFVVGMVILGVVVAIILVFAIVAFSNRRRQQYNTMS